MANGPEVITAKGGESTIRRTRFGMRMQRSEPRLNVSTRHRIQGDATLKLQPMLKRTQITAISRKCVGRQTVFEPNGIDKRADSA